jgi:hypothetical protein
MERIVCFTNENDTDDLIKYNEYGFDLKFVKKFEDLPDSKFYIISLKYGSKIYDRFVKFMRTKKSSKFIFLNENFLDDDNDFTIRDDENTESYMYVPSAALFRIKELVDSTIPSP